MIPFRSVSMSDRKVFEAFTLNGKRRNASGMFANILGWKHITNVSFAIVEGMLVQRYENKGRFAFSVPYGNGNMRIALMQLLEISEAMGYGCSLFGVPEELIPVIENALPGYFSFSSDDADSEYIFLREHLATLSGKKLQHKRNHVNKFESLYPQAIYKEITDDLIPQCKDLEKRWNDERLKDEEQSYILPADERIFTNMMLDKRNELGLRSGALLVDGRVVAFTLGGAVTSDTMDVCVEKADPEYEGSYAMINKKFAESLPEQYTYINREEDMGIEGLRQAKMSYVPEILLKNYVAVPKIKFEDSVFYNNEGMVPPPSNSTFFKN